MKPQNSLTLPQKSLLTSLESIASVVEARNTVPILSNVRLVAKDGVFTATATDSDIDMKARTPCDEAASLNTTVPAKTLVDIIKKIPNSADINLAMDADQKNLIVKSGRSRFQLQTLPSQDFPDLTEEDYSHTFQLPAAELLRLFSTTAFSISTEETRYYLNGIYFHGVDTDEGRVLRAVATNGHILAKAECAYPAAQDGEENDPMPGIIVPKKTCAELMRLIGKAEKEFTLEISVSSRKIRVSKVGDDGCGWTLTSKVIDGTFPDYTRVIPTANPISAMVDRAAMAKAAERVSTIASERGRSVKLEFATGNSAADVLRLSVTNPDAGMAEDEIEIDLDGTALTLGLNAQYLQDVLAHIKTDRVKICMADPASPTLFLAYPRDDSLFVIMPMRV